MTNNKEEFKSIVKEATESILRAMRIYGNIDTTGPNFTETPNRVARAYLEIFDGIFDDGTRVEEILATQFPARNTEMVVVGPIHVWSVCAHHFLPVEMDIWVGYLPKDSVLGLSKLARLAEFLAKKPGIQEDVTTDISDALYESLKSRGSACLIRGRHLCMVMRGVKNDAVTTTTQLRGDFLKPEVRAEFLSTVRADISHGVV